MNCVHDLLLDILINESGLKVGNEDNLSQYVEELRELFKSDFVPGYNLALKAPFDKIKITFDQDVELLNKLKTSLGRVEFVTNDKAYFKFGVVNIIGDMVFNNSEITSVLENEFNVFLGKYGNRNADNIRIKLSELGLSFIWNPAPIPCMLVR